MLESLWNTLLFRRFRLRSVRRDLADCVVSDLAENFLHLLLEAMRLSFLLDRQMRANIRDFDARYAFRDKNGSIAVGAIFRDGGMKVVSGPVEHPTVSVVFRDYKALRDFLLSPRPNILDSVLTQAVVVDGNLNYVYKFGYMATRLLSTLQDALRPH